MSREIKCTVCRAPLGEIRDARLRKGIKHICAKCESRRVQAMVELHQAKAASPPNSAADFIDSILGKRP